MKEILFYALKNDLLEALQILEGNTKLRYIQFGSFAGTIPEPIMSVAAIPHLGIATNSSAVGCTSYLIYGPGIEIKIAPLRTITDADLERKVITISVHNIRIGTDNLKNSVGLQRFAIDQRLNPDTVTFSPGGLWTKEILLYVRFATAYDSKFSQDLLKKIKAILRKQFTRVNSIYVGPEAMQMLRDGKRLTLSESSPKEFDLALK